MPTYQILTDQGKSLVDGAPFLYPGYEEFNLFIHQALKAGKLVYHISEPVTGLWIGEGNTREEAIKDFERRAKTYSLDKLKKGIAKHRAAGVPHQISLCVCGLTYSRLEANAAKRGISPEAYAAILLTREAGRTHRKKQESSNESQ